MMIYYAEWIVYDQSWFIGIFSTSQKAQDACQAFSDGDRTDCRKLLWIGLGDSLSARAGYGTFEIDALELDHAIKFNDYNPPVYITNKEAL